MKHIIYMYTNLDRNNKLLVIIILVIVALLILIGIYNFITNLINKRKYKKGNKLILNEEVKTKEEVKETPVSEVKPVEPLIHTETKEEAIENYQTSIKEEMEEIETLDETVTDLDQILVEMMNVGTQEEFDLTDFEREQEENAIISYGELCKKAGVEQIVYSKKEINKEIESKIDNDVKNVNKVPFKPSTFVSPIYGVEDKNEEEVENEFLGKLKEFRSGL